MNVLLPKSLLAWLLCMATPSVLPLQSEPLSERYIAPTLRSASHPEFDLLKKGLGTFLGHMLSPLSGLCPRGATVERLST